MTFLHVLDPLVLLAALAILLPLLLLLDPLFLGLGLVLPPVGMLFALRVPRPRPVDVL